MSVAEMRRELPDSWTVTDDGFANPGVEWTDQDEQMLDSLLSMFQHDETHDPVQCGLETPPGFIAEYGERFEWRTIRVSADLTIRELGELVGVSAPTISRWESGKRNPQAGEGARYFQWLRDTDEYQIRKSADLIWKIVAKRDGWIPGPLAEYGWDNYWNVIWKPGGLFDKWQETGTLPRFTPANAGIA